MSGRWSARCEIVLRRQVAGVQVHIATKWHSLMEKKIQ